MNKICDDIAEILPLYDRRAKKYALHCYFEQTIWILKAHDGPVIISQVNCIVNEDTLFIGDLNVFDKARVHQKFFGPIRAVLGLPPKTRDYQRKGLGTNILKFLIERAKKQKLRRIIGNLFPRDLAANPNLPRWYQSLGFEMDATGKPGMIQLELPKPTKSSTITDGGTLH